MHTETLAHKLGTTTHLSPLLMKARRLGLRTPEDLCALAVKRGCRYYDMHGDSSRVREEMVSYGSQSPAPESSLSNEELAIALLSICHPYSQLALRVGAAMLAAAGNATHRTPSRTGALRSGGTSCGAARGSGGAPKLILAGVARCHPACAASTNRCLASRHPICRHERTQPPR